MSVIYRQPSSLFIDTGSNKLTIQHGAVGTAQTVSLSILNNSAGAVGAPQYSSMVELVGSGWNSTGSASVSDKFALQCYGVSGSLTSTGRQGDGRLTVNNSYNSNSYVEALNIDGYGNLSIPGMLASSSSYTSTALPSITWTNLTMQNTYVGIVGNVPAYMKDVTGLVRLKGAFSGGAFNSGVTCFTLPAGYRPAKNMDIGAINLDDTTSSTTWLQIHSDGTCFVTGNAVVNTAMYLTNIMWFAEA